MSSGTREHFEDPADSRPCGCEEAEALKTERDTFRHLARHRGDLLVSEVERRLLAERRLALLVRIEGIVFEGSAHEQRLLDAAEQGGDPRAILYAGSVAFRRIREAIDCEQGRRVVSEELTAEERGWALASVGYERKLLRLYDAALARAEAAEKDADLKHEKLVAVGDSLRILRNCAKIDGELIVAQKARIAELEARDKHVAGEVVRICAEREALGARIARAVAELDQMSLDENHAERKCKAALEALR